MATQFAGGTYINFAQFSGTYKCLIMQGLLQNLCTNGTNAGWTNLSMNKGISSGTWGQATQGPGNVSTVTITTGTPGVVNWPSHGFLGGEKVMFQVSAGGGYPSNIAVNTIYYVVYLTANTFNVSTSYGGGGVAMASAGSGTLWCYSHYILLASATQSNVTNPIVVRIQDNTGTSVNITIQNYAGTYIANNGTIQGLGDGRYYGAGLVPVSSPNYQITATRYQFYIAQVGTNTNRDYALAGMLYVPSFLSGVTDHGFVFANCNDSESGAGPYYSFRYGMSISTNSTANSQVMWNDNICDNANNNNGQNYPGTPNPIFMQPTYYGQSQEGYRWPDLTYMSSDVLLSCGTHTISMEGKIKGQFYDMVYIPEAFALDATDTFGGHTWVNMTNNQTGVPRGGVWLATS